MGDDQVERSAEPHVTLVVAMAKNRVIGRGGDMPWRMPSSLRHFRALTLGRPMIMGRKTFASIGKVLDGRDTIIVTRDPTLRVEGAMVAHRIGQALALAGELAKRRKVDEIIVAGGGEIYDAALPYATRVHVDLIDTELSGDTFFPQLDDRTWREVRNQPITAHVDDQYPAAALFFERVGNARRLPAA